jgi:hypothetical protein
MFLLGNLLREGCACYRKADAAAGELISAEYVRSIACADYPARNGLPVT